MEKDNDTLDLMKLMITIGIFLPTAILFFYRVVNPDDSYNISLRYFLLTGIYIVSYCIAYLKKINNKFISKTIVLNLLFVASSVIYLSLVVKIPLIQSVFLYTLINIFQFILLLSTFFIFPIIILIFALFEGRTYFRKL